MVDPVRGSEHQTRMLLLALAAGEPYRIALALALEAGYLAAALADIHGHVPRNRIDPHEFGEVREAEHCRIRIMERIADR